MTGYYKETPTSYCPGAENRGNCLKSQQVRVSKWTGWDAGVGFRPDVTIQGRCGVPFRGQRFPPAARPPWAQTALFSTGRWTETKRPETVHCIGHILVHRCGKALLLLHFLPCGGLKTSTASKFPSLGPLSMTLVYDEIKWMRFSWLFKTTVNMSKRKEALINIIMLPREIIPNISHPQVPILPNYGLSVELPCTHPTFRLNSRVLSSWEDFMAEGPRTNKNVIPQYLYHFPSHPKGRRQLHPHHTALRLPPGCFAIDIAVYFFSPSWVYWGFVKKLQLHTRLLVAVWAVIKSRKWFF